MYTKGKGYSVVGKSSVGPTRRGFVGILDGPDLTQAYPSVGSLSGVLRAIRQVKLLRGDPLMECWRPDAAAFVAAARLLRASSTSH
jgi:hypothetical protein